MVPGPDGKLRQERKTDARWSKDEARQALVDRVRELAASPVERPSTPAALTFGAAIDRYLAEKAGEGKRISDYRAERIVTVLPRRGRRAQPISAATVNRELATCRALLTLAAREWDALEKVPTVRLLKEPEGRLRYLTADEIARLLAVCANSLNPHLRTIVVLAANTGARKSEILNLEWGQVDFARGVVKLEVTKSGRRREIPMNDAVYAALSALPGNKDAGRLFHKANGAAWGQIRTAFENACRTAKLANFRFHDLRHTAASQLLMRGATLTDVKAVLGHSDLKMTLRYAHLSPEHLRSAVARLNGLTAVPAPAPGPAVSAHGLAHDGRIRGSSPVSA
jgi:integrase